MKKFLLFLSIILMVHKVNAQKDAVSKPSYSLGGELILPSGDDGYMDEGSRSLGIGISGQGNVAVTNKVDATLFAGVMREFYLGSNKPGKDLGRTYIPLLAGVEIDVSPIVFGSAQAGYTLKVGDGFGSGFTVAPGIGINLSKKFTVVFKYTLQFLEDSKVSGLGVGYAYFFNR